MKQYIDIVKKVLDEGTRKQNRTGVDTISTFNVNYEIDLANGFPLLTTKEVSWKNIVMENLWFLSGARDIKFLKKHGANFWNAWADENDIVPSSYFMWTKYPYIKELEYYDENYENCDHKIFQEEENNQIEFVINELKKNPMSRRLVVSAWEPNFCQKSSLPACHLMFIFNTQTDKNGELKLNLHLTQRSCDVALGLPYNVGGYAFVLHLIAHLTKMKVGKFAHSIIDCHIYTKKQDGSMEEYDHIPKLLEQIKREPRPLPILKIDKKIKTLYNVNKAMELSTDKILKIFKLENYNPHPKINFKVAV